MGWLQGSRYNNLQLLQQNWNTRSAKPTSTHVEIVLPSRIRKDASVATEDNLELVEQNESKSCKNEIEDLLEATFGQGKLRNGQKTAQTSSQPTFDQRRTSISHTHRAFQDQHLDDQQLPFISKEEVMSVKLAVGKNGLVDEQNSECLWIVVDNIVYDCSEFITDHPGGKQVILSFVGEDCSWQFWRFHSRSEMEQYGRPLRIGRTDGVSNRFEERPKYVGLRNNSQDEWT